jgi:HD-like signal output (HDOD) protein
MTASRVTQTIKAVTQSIRTLGGSTPPASKPTQTQSLRTLVRNFEKEQPQEPVPVTPLTLMDIIKEIEAGGIPKVDAIAWSGLAEDVMANATELPPLPSFPAVAGQVMTIINRKNLDINELVSVVQRDAAIASTLIRAANTAAFSPATSISSLRGAIQALGTQQVFEVVLASSGRKYYEVATKAELALFPELWRSMFGAASANAFAACRFALDVRNAQTDTALLAGLLADLGRPIALRIIAKLIIAKGYVVDEPIVLAALDEVGPAISARMIESLHLPVALQLASTEWHIGQLVAAIGAVQRRTLRIWANAAVVREHATHLALEPMVLRTLFASRATYQETATSMFR